MGTWAVVSLVSNLGTLMSMIFLFCVPYDVVLLLDVPVVLFCVPYYVVFFLLDVPMDLCTQLYSPVQCTMYSTWLTMYLKC